MTQIVPTSAQSRLSHPATPGPRQTEALRIHLPGEESFGLHRRQGAGAYPAKAHQPLAGSPAAPAQPGAARLDQLLPIRGCLQDLQLPACLPLAPSGPMATRQASPSQLEAAATPPPIIWVVAHSRRGDIVQPVSRLDSSIPLPGQHHPLTVAQTDGRDRRIDRRRDPVESRMLGDGHVRFGGRARETGQPKG
jgi:hypothetical protein